MNLKEFKSPSAKFRPAPFWSWNDKLTGEELQRQISEMAQKGWGGYFMHSRVGLVTGYLSDEWMDLITLCAEQAGKTNTYAWLYDEDKWPSGFAGGKVPLSNEDYRSRALVFVQKGQEDALDKVLGEATKDGTVFSICRRISPLGAVWFNKTSYVDLMNPEAVKAFLDCTHEEYKKSCGKYFGKEIPGIFTDEPCYLMNNQYNVPAIPWSDYLPDYFESLNGYKIEEHLPELFLNIGDYKKVRNDFYFSATKLFIESFTKQYYDWCDKNDLIMTGHFMCEDDLLRQTQWIGAAMPHYQFMHWPGIDKLSRHIQQLVTVKQLTSVADQLEKERTFSEVFGCVGQQVSFYHRKWIADWQAALGISFVNHHLSLYSMRGERKRDYPANLFYQQPWWDSEKKFSDYIGRLSYTAAVGKREVNILVIHPIGSVWSEFTPLDRENDFCGLKNDYDRPFEMLSKQLMANKLDFHYGDEIIMQENASVKNGKFIVGAYEYDTVIVPPCSMLSDSTLKLLNEFLKQAGNERLLVLKGVKVSGLSDAARIVDSDEAMKELDEYYSKRTKVANKITGKNASEILVHTRNTQDGKCILLANTDKDKKISASVQIYEAGDVKILDLMSGEAYNAPTLIQGQNTMIDIEFHPAGSVVVLVDSKLSGCGHVPEFLDCGVTFNAVDEIVASSDDWQVDVLEDNVLVLDDVTLYLNSEMVLDNKPVSMAWHEHFYKASDGTPFAAEYQFKVSEIPEGDIYAVIEVAENLNKITLNGIEVNPIKEKGDCDVFDTNKNWKDVSFTKVPITNQLTLGENVLRLEGEKVNNISGPGCHIGVEDFANHQPTEVEAVYIVGDFDVENLNREKFTIRKKRKIKNAFDICEDGYPFYAGKAKFSTKIHCDGDEEKFFIQINNANCACARLFLNGAEIGIKYWDPFVYDVSEYIKKGENDLEIIASDTLFNVMGPNRISGILDNDSVGPGTFIQHDKFTAKRELVPFGLGKVNLLKKDDLGAI